MENGKVAPVVGLPTQYAAGSTEFHVFRPTATDQRYLWHWLVSRAFRARAQRRMSGSAGQLRVPIDYLREAEIPLAPLAEQRRIVARIDELFTEIAEGEAAAAAARRGLETYRRALLKAAVTGELTRDWREENKPAETGHKLLARIRAEREAKAPAKGRARRAASAPLDETNLPQLPEGWAWARLGDISWDSSYGTSKKCAYEFSGVSVLRIPNIRRGAIAYTDLKFGPDDFDLDASELVSAGDLLIIRTNGSEELIGRGGVQLEPIQRPTYFASYLIRFRLSGGEAIWRWLGLYFESPVVRHWMIGQAASSAGQYNVSQSALARLAVPIPPPSELAEILRRVSDALSAASDTLAALDAEAADAARLRQSVLKAAFEGRLAPQDPADEPAAALLARLAEAPAKAPSRRNASAGRSRLAAR